MRDKTSGELHLDLFSQARVNSDGPFNRMMNIMLSPSSHDLQISKVNRAPWRQRLVDAETGFRLGLRTDSILFVYLFVGSMVAVSGMVLGLTRLEWVLLVLTLGLTLSVELFHQLLKFIVEEFRHHLRKDLNQMMRLGTAAVVTTNVTALTVIAILLGSRIIELCS